MATNPMKRRERNSFLIGAIIAFAVMGIVLFFMYKQYANKKDQLEQLQALQTKAVVAADKIESGATLSKDDFTIVDVRTGMSSDDYYKSIDDIFYEESANQDGELYELALAAKLEIPAGTIITPNMLIEDGQEITNDMRLQEYSSIALPSQLKNGEYIDIRLTLPTGQDYIVLSKKEVLQTDESTIWINVNEAEILLLNSAMVEAWTITGTKLYAIEYIDAGSQEDAYVTYEPTAEVLDLIKADPNVVDKAYAKLSDGLNSLGKSEHADKFRNYIDSALSEHIEDRESSAEEGFTSEITTMKEHRADYVEALEGTGKIGSNEVTSEK